MLLLLLLLLWWWWLVFIVVQGGLEVVLKLQLELLKLQLEATE